MATGNRVRAAEMVSNHCKLECVDRNTRACSSACYKDLVGRVEAILNEREQNSKSTSEGEST